MTPEKRTVFLAIENRLLEAVREFFAAHFGSAHSAAVPLVVNEAAQTAALPLRFGRNRSAPPPSATAAAVASSSSTQPPKPVPTVAVAALPPSPSPSGSLFQAFGFRRAASAPPAIAASTPPTTVKEELQCCSGHGSSHAQPTTTIDVDLDMEEEKDEEVRVVKEEAAAPASQQKPKNVFAEFFAFGSAKRPRPEEDSVVAVASAAAAAAPVSANAASASGVAAVSSVAHLALPDPFLVEEEAAVAAAAAPVKRSKTAYIDEQEDDEMPVMMSQDVPPEIVDEEIADEPRSLSSSSSALEFDVERAKALVRRRREAQKNAAGLPRCETPSTFQKEDFGRLEVVGQFNRGFIIARLRGTSDLFIVDQHASNEIFNFETLQKTTTMRVQRLLAPITIEFSPDEEIDVVNNLKVPSFCFCDCF